MSRARLDLEALQRSLEGGVNPGAELVLTLVREQVRLQRRLDKISRISDRYQAQLQELNQQLGQANQRLSQTLAEVKTLRGFIPICAKCKRIRDDQGYWDQLEDYLSRHSEAVFSHGVCPDCAEALYGELAPRTMQTLRRERVPQHQRRRPREEDETLHVRLAEVLQRPEHAENPLRGELEALLGTHLRLLSRFEKILKISDGFQSEMKHLNRALAEASRLDPLTGLLNRRGMMERLAAELARAERTSAPLAAVMADVDHFKAINDRMGHEVGDLVLQSLGASIRASLRGYDACARWGGEEFLLLLPGADLAAAEAVANKLKDLISEHQLAVDEAALSVSVSIGVALRRPGEAGSALLNRADAALYRAKAQGRNRVEVDPA